jgi:hypothetical protein
MTGGEDVNAQFPFPREANGLDDVARGDRTHDEVWIVIDTRVESGDLGAGPGIAAGVDLAADPFGEE